MDVSRQTVLVVVLAVLMQSNGQPLSPFDMQCYQCNDVSTPDQCNTRDYCGQDEICFTREYIRHDGVRSFHLGCERRDICNFYLNGKDIFGKRDAADRTSSHGLSSSDGNSETGDVNGERRESDQPTQLCFDCCTSDFCNEELCLDATELNRTGLPHSHLRCPDGFVQGHNSCLYFAIWPEVWADAAKSCERMGAHLVKIEDQAEDFAILELIKHYTLPNSCGGYWIGAHRNSVADKTWKWMDGTPVTYFRWGPGEPSDVNELMLMLANPKVFFSNWEWGDWCTNCTGGFICERTF